MATLHKTDRNGSLTESFQCKCTKSETRMNRQSKPYLEKIAANIEERHCDLTGRHRYLREKVTTMERSIPALMAFNMLKSGKTCDDAPFCKIREIMNKLSPELDPTEKLLRNLKSTVKDLNMETTELHDKIIDADVKLEETDIELESLELANKEMNDQADKIEKEIRSYQSTSLHSIHSEDVVCLTKIHQLAKDELELKNCITQLEEKEILYVEQLDRLLASREVQTMSGSNKMLKRIQDLESNERKMYYALQFYKNNVQQLKKELVRKKSDNNIDATTPVTNSKQLRDKPLKVEENETDPSKTLKNRMDISNEETDYQKKVKRPVLTNEKNHESKLCICLKKFNHKMNPTNQQKLTKSSTRMSPNVCPLKSNHTRKNPCLVNLPCDLPPCAVLSNCPRAPCDLEITSNNSYSSSCNKCRLSQNKNECRCNCKGKCAYGLSSVPCRCGAGPSCPLDKGYQPVAESSLHISANNSDSDEEYCECCSCGCEDSDNSTCYCN
ncbi:kinetochore protein SLK19-like [Vespula squamosa]|uniref:Kinetochore protein SLK19-like n=1 Tax=Vespula squamosa TaxID=30214 RepID=A0ABD2BEE3_VESSQ